VILVNLPVSNSTQEHVFHRAKDIDEDVRLASLNYMAKNYNFDELDRLDCIGLISDALNDRVEVIHKAAVNLIVHWVETSEGGYIGFLSKMEVPSTEVVIDEALKLVFAEKPVEHSKVKLADVNELNISNEQAYLLRVYCDYVQEKSNRENVHSKATHSVWVFFF